VPATAVRSPGPKAVRSPGPKLALRLDEAGAMLGVSRRTVERLILDGDLHVVKIRGLSRLLVTDVEDYARSLKRVTRISGATAS
jgi:excisionase family DNA binding protein